MHSERKPLADARDARLLEDNLAALASRQPDLAASVLAASPDPRLVPLPARNGMIVPGVRSATGTVPLHSLYDPRQESTRLAASVRGAGFLVVIGMGAGFHIAALLENPEVQVVVVIEKDTAVLRSLFAQIPLARLLADPRVALSAGLETIRESVLAGWQPALMGGMRTVPLRPWCDQEPSFFDAAAAEVHAAIEEVRGDYSVQSHFGKRWLTNILMNLAQVESAPHSIPRGATAAVTAAGPSLEQQLPRLAAEREGILLVATDTSLPALVRSGIRPDVVLSIDCQNHGYHHFLLGIPTGTSLFLDLASPPLLARRPVPPVFVASAHPFVRYVDSHWSRLMRIDTSGGNVTHAAVTLARALGARRISVYGADFSYPDGKAYARGTYLYDHFWTEQSRLSPAEGSFYLFVHGSAQAHRLVRSGRVLYTTPLLLGYRERFMKLMETIDADVIPVPGLGLELLRSGKKAPALASAETDPWPPPGDSPSRRWKEFLTEYAWNIERLPPCAAGNRGSERELWSTILPVAARVVREGVTPGPAALEEARRWSLERIRRVLQLPLRSPRG
jgi:hypothetical protein